MSFFSFCYFSSSIVWPEKKMCFLDVYHIHIIMIYDPCSSILWRIEFRFVDLQRGNDGVNPKQYASKPFELSRNSSQGENGNLLLNAKKKKKTEFWTAEITTQKVIPIIAKSQHIIRNNRKWLEFYHNLRLITIIDIENWSLVNWLVEVFFYWVPR